MAGEEKEWGSVGFGYGGAELEPQCAEEKVHNSSNCCHYNTIRVLNFHFFM